MRVKNNSQNTDVWCGQTLTSNQEYDIEPNELFKWRNTDKVILDLSNGNLLIGDGVNYKSIGSSAVNYLLGTSQEVIVSQQPVFSAKTIGSKKLFSRTTGKIFALSVGLNTLDYTITFNEVKFNGLELDKCKFGEKITLKILDTNSGLKSGVPNYTLNTFGFDVNLPDGFYRRISDYDADLVKDLIIRIEYTATEARNIGINYMLHELKL